MVRGKIIGFSSRDETCIVLLEDGTPVQVPKANFPGRDEGSIVEIDSDNFGSSDERSEEPQAKRMRYTADKGLLKENSKGGDESLNTTRGKRSLKTNCSSDERSELPLEKRMRSTTMEGMFMAISKEGDESSYTTHGKPSHKMNCYVCLDLFGL